jgi:hypothetical protein
VTAAGQANGSGGEAGTGPEEPKVRTSRFDILIAVLLGVTALLAASAAYLSDRDDGRQLRYLQEADVTLAQANDLYAAADQQKALDQTIFVNYTQSNEVGDSDLADYLIGFSPDLRRAIRIWSSRPFNADSLTPFSGSQPAYTLTLYADGDALLEESEALFAKGDFYDERGDSFVLATVFLALALALLGVASVIWIRGWRVGLTAAGIASTLAGAAIMMVNLV